MTNNQLTDEQIALWRADAESVMQTGYAFSEEYAAARAIFELASELQEHRKAAEPELKPANLVKKFYECYPVASFKSDTERAEALGYFMAGAELQCFGEFIKYEDLFCDE
ncbi:TPA: hypothetical protein ACGTUJ_000350 [Escherichia coli]